MPIARGRLAAAGRELAQRVLANRLEHAEPRLPRAVGQVHDETGIEELLEAVRRIASVNGLDRIERNGPCEDSESAEHIPGVRTEEVVAPVDRGAQGAVPGREVRSVAGKQGEALAQSLRRAFRAEDTDAGRGELDRQREPVERAADPRHRGRVVVCDLEARDDRAHALDVEPDGGGVTDGGGRLRTLLRELERLDPVLVLHRQPQRNAARGEDPQRRARCEELTDGRVRPGKVLEVVEDEQRRIGERRGEMRGDRPGGCALGADRGGDRRQDELRVEDGRQVHEDGGARLVRDRECEPRLADAPGAGERDQAGFAPAHERGDRSTLEVAPDERRGRRELWVGRRRRRRVEPRILAQDRLLEVAQLRAGVDAEPVHERGPRLAVGLERLGLAIRAVQRQDELRTQALAQGLGGDERVELRHQRGVAAERELRIEASLQRDQPQLLETTGLAPRERLVGEIRERGSAPETERFSEDGGGAGAVPLAEQPLSLADEALEPLGVDLAFPEAEQVPGRARDDPVRAQRLPERVHLHLERALGGRRGRLSPHGVDQPIRRDDLVRIQRETREHGTHPRAAQREGLPVVADDFERAENPKLEHESAAS